MKWTRESHTVLKIVIKNVKNTPIRKTSLRAHTVFSSLLYKRHVEGVFFCLDEITSLMCFYKLYLESDNKESSINLHTMT